MLQRIGAIAERVKIMRAAEIENRLYYGGSKEYWNRIFIFWKNYFSRVGNCPGSRPEEQFIVVAADVLGEGNL
jgi:hypothetical protein